MSQRSSAQNSTRKYADKFQALSKAGHYRELKGLTISSIGLGTYLGKPDKVDDDLYVEAVQEALLGGCNLIDSAINYRCMRSERNIGEAVRSLTASGKITRDEVVICTKGGFIPYDGAPPSDPGTDPVAEYVSKGLCSLKDVVAGCHCIAPAYLRDQVGRSLSNLGLDHIDLYYIHNPETQLDEVPKAEFLLRLDKSFSEMEKLTAEGKIGAYGVATWNGFRVASDAPGYLSLHEVLRTAEKAGGSRHHFSAVQLPYNMAMAEAWGFENQVLGAQTVSMLKAAKANDIAVFTSASLLQSKLTKGLPEGIHGFFPGLYTDAQRALQFARSTPGVTASLAGMKRKEHVRENLKVASVEPLSETVIQALFKD